MIDVLALILFWYFLSPILCMLVFVLIDSRHLSVKQWVVLAIAFFPLTIFYILVMKPASWAWNKLGE